ncbi:MAG: hypothetical protein V4640_07640 [Verrucomicrobiota bacterium]
MKVSPRFFLQCAVVVPLFTTPASGLQAEGVRSSSHIHLVVTAVSEPSRLIARLSPDDVKSKLDGTLNFEIAADAIHVAGDVSGLDSDKLYRLHLPLAKAVAPGGKPCVQSPENPALRQFTESVGDLRPDARGTLSINTFVKGARLGSSFQEIVGKPVVLMEIGKQGVDREPIRVARAVVVLPTKQEGLIPPSKLDDLEPGEHWF